jgi:hypothetical protein
MEVRFVIDLHTGLPHITQHNVEPQEVLEVFRNRPDDIPNRDDTRMCEGQTAQGRCLRVIYTVSRTDGSVLVITAYDLIGKSLQAYRRRRRRRRQ